MPEPRTHYQLSFTSRQALGLFVVILLSLGLAFFFGLMTGLSRRADETSPVAASSPSRAEPSPEASGGGAETAIPSAQSAPRNRPGDTGDAGAEAPSRTRLASERSASSAGAPTPGLPSTLETFDDRGSSEPTGPVPGRPEAPGRRAGSAAPAPPGFWVQVLSSRSEKEAAARRARYASHGYPAAVQPAPGAGGTVYRVRLGPYASREEASRAAERLRASEKVETWIVPSGS